MNLASLGSMFSSAGQIAGGVQAISSLFDGGDGASANDLARSQLYHSLLGMKHAPYATVVGLRRAGLNPMLAIGKATPAPSIGMPSPVDDRQVSTARMAVTAQLAQVASQTALNSAQADYFRAQTETEKKRPENVAMDTAGKLSAAMLNEALQTKAKNEGLLVAANTVQQELINEINKSGWLAESKKQELLRLVAQVKVSQSDASRARTDDAFYQSELGSIMRTVRLVLNALGIGGR